MGGFGEKISLRDRKNFFRVVACSAPQSPARVWLLTSGQLRRLPRGQFRVGNLPSFFRAQAFARSGVNPLPLAWASGAGLLLASRPFLGFGRLQRIDGATLGFARAGPLGLGACLSACVSNPKRALSASDVLASVSYPLLSAAASALGFAFGCGLRLVCPACGVSFVALCRNVGFRL